MLINLWDNNTIIDYLFYGIDMVSNLIAIDKVSAYKIKYNRLLKTKYNMALTISSISLLLNDLFEIIEDPKYKDLINKKKMDYIKNTINIDSSRLIFNNILAYSFIEINKNNLLNEDLVNELVSEIKKKLPLLKDLIYDDTYNDTKIVTIDFPSVIYDKINIPDVHGYNVYVIDHYIKLISDNWYYYNDSDNNQIFNLALSNFLNNKEYSNDIKLYNMYYTTITKLFNKDNNNSNLMEIYRILIQYINKNNLSNFIKLQYKLFKFLLENNNDYNKDMIYKIHTFLSFDIILYNKTHNIEDLSDIMKNYNFYIIQLRDMIDYIFVPSKRRDFIDMYRSQLLKSRNKIRERMLNK